MSTHNLARYTLAADHALHHWLAYGTLTSPVEALPQVVPTDGSPFGQDRRWVLNYWAWSQPSKRIKQRLYAQLPQDVRPPAGQPALNALLPDGKQWRYALAAEDQVIDFSLFNFTATLMQGWLFALLDAPQAMTVDAELLTIGPARLFLNDQLVIHYTKSFSYVALQYVPVRLSLQPGLNPLYLHGEMFGWREARLALGLRFAQPADLGYCLPLGDVTSEAWHRAEAGLAAARL